MKEIIDRLDDIKIKNSMKDNVEGMRRQATDQEKISARHTSNKGLLPKIYKGLLNLK